MKITIHRGTHQIGGNCVEVSTDRTRLVLDAGLPLPDPAALISLRPKRVADADLPAVPELFSAGPAVHGLLLSHAHSDHTGLVGSINPAVPVYCAKGTSKMLMAGSIFARQAEPQHQRPLLPGKTISIGDIHITPLSVDHSAFDSVALLLEAADKRLLYSGDLRLHGPKPGMFAQLKKHLAHKPVDVLVMEGTNLRQTNSANCRSEAEVQLFLTKSIHRVLGPLVLANFSPQHVDRLVSFYKAAVRNGRELVVDVYTAFIMHLVRSQCKIPAPTKRNGIRVYYNQSFERTWQRKNLQKIHGMFLQDRIDMSEILSKPHRYVMVFRPSMLALDFQGRLPEETLCIYSQWSGYLQKPEYRALSAAIEHCHGRLIECHTSGHVLPNDLIEFVQAVNPRLVIPIHTTSPNQFKTLFPNTRVLSDGEEYAI